VAISHCHAVRVSSAHAHLTCNELWFQFFNGILDASGDVRVAHVTDVEVFTG
jgi:hypothetical protein